MGSEITRNSEYDQTKWFLYILKLKDDKYYVGSAKGNRIEKDIKLHKKGRGSEWTKKYPYLSVLTVKEIESISEEDNEVKKIMIQNGIDSVRGGVYNNVIIYQYHRAKLQREIYYIQGVCINCGSKDHATKQCPQNRCTRCGRNVHKAGGGCFSKTTVEGELINDKLYRAHTA